MAPAIPLHRHAPGLVLISLILVAAVANLNLSVANIARRTSASRSTRPRRRST
jgi:hypothetical protein